MINLFAGLNDIKRLCVLVIFVFFLAACGGKQGPVQDSSSSAGGNGDGASTSAEKTVLFFGDSLTAGYGLDDPTDAFPGVIQKKIDSSALHYHVINAGVSGETSAGGKSRINWTLKQPVDVFILELGANDGLRGIPVTETIANLQAIIDAVKAKYPKAKLVMLGMQIPPSMGARYVSGFKALFPELAAKNNMALVPFLLKDVGGVPSLNQKDGIHPTAEGAKIVANTVWQVLQGVLVNKS
jgi:acyl-CoA thioesterase-1